MSLIAERNQETWTVRDTNGGVWWPDDEAAKELEEAAYPDAVILEMVYVFPHRGEWKD